MPTRFTMKRSLIQQRFALPKVRVYLEIAQKGNPEQKLVWFAAGKIASVT